MLVFSADTAPVFQNALASELMGDAPHTWVDKSGQPVVIDDLTRMLVHDSGKPIFQHALALTSAGRRTIWLSINVFTFSHDGSVRRILLTLTDISEERQLQSEISKLTTRDPLTGVFNRAR